MADDFTGKAKELREGFNLRYVSLFDSWSIGT